MSKKNKVSLGKAGNKKPVKKAAKAPAKKVATKKAVVKQAKAKTTVKPAVKNKTTAKPASTAKNKAVAKKAAPKKPAKAVNVKPAAKSNSKKTVVKPKPAPAKPAPKKVIAKAPAKPKKIEKPAKKMEQKAEKPSKPVPVKEIPKPKPAPEKEAAVKQVKKTEEVLSKKELAEKRSNDVLAISNTIPVKAANEISPSKIASISHSITNPIKKTDSYAIKPEKEPNGKFELEFVVHASAEMLYEFLSTPSGLSEWFCDDLNIRNGIYTFIWEDQLQQARLLKTIELQLVKFQWVDKTDGSYFEFRIQRDDLTNDISLIITDFADSIGDRESSKLLWNSQIEKLMHVIGSIF